MDPRAETKAVGFSIYAGSDRAWRHASGAHSGARRFFSTTNTSVSNLPRPAQGRLYLPDLSGPSYFRSRP